MVAVLALWGALACTSNSEIPLTGKRLTSVRFAASERMPCAPCDMILVADDSVRFHIKETTGNALIGPDSIWVVYTTFGGAGGYRGSGQALWRFNIRTAVNTEIMREYYLVEQLSILKVPGGVPMVLVSMREPMSLVRHFAIVDPDRGEVFRAERSVVTQSDTGGLTITEWGAPTNWGVEALSDSTGLPKAPPVRKWRLNLAQLRQFAVLTNQERIWGTSIQFAPSIDSSTKAAAEEPPPTPPEDPTKPPT